MTRTSTVRAALTTVAALATVALTATACSSDSAGHGSAARTSVTDPGPVATTTVTRTASGTPSAPTSAPTATASSSVAPRGGSGGDPTLTQPARLACAGTPLRLTDCFGNSLATYWRDHSPANQQADQVVYLQIPTGSSECAQAARTADGPFTCTADLGELYFPPSFRKKLSSWFSAADLPYAYASVMSHEYGHYLQLDVHDRNVTDRHRTQQESKAVEQQADCLSGVWAHDAAINHHFDAGRFDAVAQELIRNVSSNYEVSTHGTPDQRFAALDRGLGTGRPSSCGLAGLH